MKKIYIAALLLAVASQVSAQQTASPSEKPVKFLLSANGGFGTRTARISEDVPQNLRDHFRRLRTGPVLAFEIGAKVSPSTAFTVSYSSFGMSNDNFVYSQLTSINTSSGPVSVLTTNRLSTNDRISVITGNWLSFAPLNTKGTVLFTTKLGIGAATFRSSNTLEVLQVGSSSFTVTGTGLALTGGGGLDIKLSKSLFLSFNGEFTQARAKVRSDIAGANNEEAEEALSNLRFTGGLRLVL